MTRDNIMFEHMTVQELNEAFEVVLKSPEYLRWGFDYVDDEAFEELICKLSTYHRKQIGIIFDLQSNVTIKRLRDLFVEDAALRVALWREAFKRLDRISKELVLEDNLRYYIETISFIERDKYDWTKFYCTLEKEGQNAKLQQIKTGWNEFGTQVYGCSTNNNGGICLCLRQSSNSTGYRCFKDYLENNGKSPYDKVPTAMLYE